MTELIAVFRSRAQAVDCNARLRSLGVPSSVISTPKEAQIGCGLSVKIPANFEKRCKMIISRGGYSGFYGYFKVKIY